MIHKRNSKSLCNPLGSPPFRKGGFRGIYFIEEIRYER